MASTFFGLEIAKRGLLAQQTAMNTVAHNIANASTPGYTRQSVELVATYPYTIPTSNRDISVAQQLGTGVATSAITSLRNTLLNGRVQDAQSTQSAAGTLSDSLTQLQAVFNEPSSGTNTGDTLTQFWSALSDIANNPQDMGVRANALNVAQSVTDNLHYLNTSINNSTADLNSQVSSAIASINNIADAITNLNKQIFSVINVGDTPNDLIDQRTQLMDKLSNLTNYQSTNMENGMTKIEINGETLVGGNWDQKLSAVPDPLNNNNLMPVFPDGDTAVITGGSLKGLIDARDTFIPAYKTQIDSLAQALMTGMNALQQTGYGMNAAAPSAMDFFSGTNAGDITVNPALIAAPSLVAAAANALSAGDGTNALAMSDIKDSFTMAGGTMTMNQYYANLISNVGSDVSKATSDSGIYSAFSTQLGQQKSSETGVSLDQEMTDLIKYQHAYTANTKVTSMMDTMLQTLLDMIK